MGRALARQNTRPDTLMHIKYACHPPYHQKGKENEAQPTPRHATQEPSCIKASRQGHGSLARKPRRARGFFSYPPGADPPCSPVAQPSGFQVKIPDSSRTTMTTGALSPKDQLGPTPSQSHTSLMCRRGAPEPSHPFLADHSRFDGLQSTSTSEALWCTIAGFDQIRGAHGDWRVRR